MKKIIFLSILSLFLFSGCLDDQKQAATKVLDPCLDNQLVNSFIKDGFEQEQCLEPDFNGDQQPELVLYQKKSAEMEFYDNGYVSAYRYHPAEETWEEFFGKFYDVDATLEVEVYDFGQDGQYEMLLKQKMGASGSALYYDVYAWNIEMLSPLVFDKAYDKPDDYLQDQENGAAYHDVEIKDGQLIESFKTYNPQDSMCCPSGHNVEVIYEYIDGNFVEQEASSEKLPDNTDLFDSGI